MSIDRTRIRVKAMLIAPNDAGTHHAVSVNGPTVENPLGFYRLIGGGVELGETHRSAVIREVREELQAEIHDLEYLGMVENIFRFEGELGHEIVAIYTGRLDPAPTEVGAVLTESNGAVVPVTWQSFDDLDTTVPLYPAGAIEWVRILAHTDG